MTLYHGTDARMVSMSKEERMEYLTVVDHVASSLWKVYEPYYHKFVPYTVIRNGEEKHTYKKAFESYIDILNSRGYPDMYSNLTLALSRMDSRNQGEGLYQYGALYLAGTNYSAEKYAHSSFAGGERGLNAYRLIEGMNILQFPEWEPDSCLQMEIDRIMDFASFEKADPVVITLEGIDTDNLISEDGTPASAYLQIYYDALEKGRPTDFKFRYNGDLDLSKFPVVHVRKK